MTNLLYNIETHISPDTKQLALAVFLQIKQIVQHNNDYQQPTFIAIPGGNTPHLLYQLMATSKAIDWRNTHFFFTDERYVTMDNPNNNYYQFKKALAIHANNKNGSIHPINTNLDSADKAALAYSQLMREVIIHHQNGLPIFDLIILGIGEDGHTASLFAEIEFSTNTLDLCQAFFIKQLNSWRISLTFTLLNNAKQCLFMVSGKKKANIVHQLIFHPSSNLPAARVKPQGKLLLYLDQQAASLL